MESSKKSLYNSEVSTPRQFHRLLNLNLSFHSFQRTGENIELYQSKEKILQEWSKIKDDSYNDGLRKREQEIFLASIFSQILTDIGGEIAEYVIERVNSVLTSVKI